jgi:DNA-binding GntR family transcriptional regulator
MADEVADCVREAIYAGVYAPGAPLREVELATVLRVSRGPVREALLRLEREGLVCSEWHRGTTVTTLSAEEVDELYSLRDVLEGLAVQRLIRHASDAELQAVGAAADRMDGAADKHTTVQQDLDFHDAVFAAAHHADPPRHQRRRVRQARRHRAPRTRRRAYRTRRRTRAATIRRPPSACGSSGSGSDFAELTAEPESSKVDDAAAPGCGHHGGRIAVPAEAIDVC